MDNKAGREASDHAFTGLLNLRPVEAELPEVDDHLELSLPHYPPDADQPGEVEPRSISAVKHLPDIDVGCLDVQVAEACPYQINLLKLNPVKSNLELFRPKLVNLDAEGLLNEHDGRKNKKPPAPFKIQSLEKLAESQKPVRSEISTTMMSTSGTGWRSPSGKKQHRGGRSGLLEGSPTASARSDKPPLFRMFSSNSFPIEHFHHDVKTDGESKNLVLKVHRIPVSENSEGEWTTKLVSVPAKPNHKTPREDLLRSKNKEIFSKTMRLDHQTLLTKSGENKIKIIRHAEVPDVKNKNLSASLSFKSDSHTTPQAAQMLGLIPRSNSTTKKSKARYTFVELGIISTDATVAGSFTTIDKPSGGSKSGYLLSATSLIPENTTAGATLLNKAHKVAATKPKFPKTPFKQGGIQQEATITETPNTNSRQPQLAPTLDHPNAKEQPALLTSDTTDPKPPKTTPKSPQNASKTLKPVSAIIRSTTTTDLNNNTNTPDIRVEGEAFIKVPLADKLAKENRLFREQWTARVETFRLVGSAKNGAFRFGRSGGENSLGQGKVVRSYPIVVDKSQKSTPSEVLFDDAKLELMNQIRDSQNEPRKNQDTQGDEKRNNLKQKSEALLIGSSKGLTIDRVVATNTLWVSHATSLARLMNTSESSTSSKAIFTRKISTPQATPSVVETQLRRKPGAGVDQPSDVAHQKNIPRKPLTAAALEDGDSGMHTPHFRSFAQSPRSQSQFRERTDISFGRVSQGVLPSGLEQFNLFRASDKYPSGTVTSRKR